MSERLQARSLLNGREGELPKVLGAEESFYIQIQRREGNGDTQSAFGRLELQDEVGLECWNSTREKYWVLVERGAGAPAERGAGARGVRATTGRAPRCGLGAWLWRYNLCSGRAAGEQSTTARARARFPLHFTFFSYPYLGCR